MIYASGNVYYVPPGLDNKLWKRLNDSHPTDCHRILGLEYDLQEFKKEICRLYKSLYKLDFIYGDDDELIIINFSPEELTAFLSAAA